MEKDRIVIVNKDISYFDDEWTPKSLNKLTLNQSAINYIFVMF